MYMFFPDMPESQQFEDIVMINQAHHLYFIPELKLTQAHMMQLIK